jgi:hypothetical protein
VAIGRPERRTQEPFVQVEPVYDPTTQLTSGASKVTQTMTECDVDHLFLPALLGAAGGLSARDAELVADLQRAPTLAAFFGSLASGASGVAANEGAAAVADDAAAAAAAVVPAATLSILETVLLFLGKELGPYGRPTPLHRLSFEARLLCSLTPEPPLAVAALQQLYAGLEGPYSHDHAEEARAYESSSMSGMEEEDDDMKKEEEDAAVEVEEMPQSCDREQSNNSATSDDELLRDLLQGRRR